MPKNAYFFGKKYKIAAASGTTVQNLLGLRRLGTPTQITAFLFAPTDVALSSAFSNVKRILYFKK